LFPYTPLFGSLLVERLISVQREDLDGVEFAQSRSCLSDLMSTRQKYEDIPAIVRGERRAERAPDLDFDRAVVRPIVKLNSDRIRATFAPQTRRRRPILLERRSIESRAHRDQEERLFSPRSEPRAQGEQEVEG